MKVIGLDLSITATGVAFNTGIGGSREVHTETISVKGKDRRLQAISDHVLRRSTQADLVLIEGFLNHSKSAGITGMVHGAVRSALIQHQILYGVMPPSSLKKFATGRGNADKTAMALAALKRGGVEFRDDNQCDAWWLWVAGMCHLGVPPFQIPVVQWDQLSKIDREVL